MPGVPTANIAVLREGNKKFTKIRWLAPQTHEKSYNFTRNRANGVKIEGQNNVKENPDSYHTLLTRASWELCSPKRCGTKSRQRTRPENGGRADWHASKDDCGKR